MDVQGFKKLLDESLSPIKKDLQGVKNDLHGVKEDLAGIKETQEDHTSRLEALSGDMEQVLSEVKATLDLPLIPDSPQA